MATRLHLLATGLAWALAAPVAQALPATTLEWLQPTGTTSGVEHVDIWVRLTVNATAGRPLVLDGGTTSFGPEDLPALSAFARIDAVASVAIAACENQATALSACSAPEAPWALDFNLTRDPSIYLSQNLVLLPGQSKDFLFGSFRPQHGPVAPGLYSFRNASFGLLVTGVDANAMPLQDLFYLGSTCASLADNCAFTRRVTGVPEPTAWALMAVGLGAVGAARRWVSGLRPPAAPR